MTTNVLEADVTQSRTFIRFFTAGSGVLLLGYFIACKSGSNNVALSGAAYAKTSTFHAKLTGKAA